MTRFRILRTTRVSTFALLPHGAAHCSHARRRTLVETRRLVPSAVGRLASVTDPSTRRTPRTQRGWRHAAATNSEARTAARSTTVDAIASSRQPVAEPRRDPRSLATRTSRSTMKPRHLSNAALATRPRICPRRAPKRGSLRRLRGEPSSFGTSGEQRASNAAEQFGPKPRPMRLPRLVAPYASAPGPARNRRALEQPLGALALPRAVETSRQRAIARASDAAANLPRALRSIARRRSASSTDSLHLANAADLPLCINRPATRRSARCLRASSALLAVASASLADSFSAPRASLSARVASSSASAAASFSVSAKTDSESARFLPSSGAVASFGSHQRSVSARSPSTDSRRNLVLARRPRAALWRIRDPRSSS